MRPCQRHAALPAPGPPAQLGLGVASQSPAPVVPSASNLGAAIICPSSSIAHPSDAAASACCSAVGAPPIYGSGARRSCGDQHLRPSRHYRCAAGAATACPLAAWHAALPAPGPPAQLGLGVASQSPAVVVPSASNLGAAIICPSSSTAHPSDAAASACCSAVGAPPIYGSGARRSCGDQHLRPSRRFRCAAGAATACPLATWHAALPAPGPPAQLGLGVASQSPAVFGPSTCFFLASNLGAAIICPSSSTAHPSDAAASACCSAVGAPPIHGSGARRSCGDQHLRPSRRYRCAAGAATACPLATWHAALPAPCGPASARTACSVGPR